METNLGFASLDMVMFELSFDTIYCGLIANIPIIDSALIDIFIPLFTLFYFIAWGL